MIKASLLYSAITVLLALIDAIRIKKAKGIVENINHKVSSTLAGIAMVIVNVCFIHGALCGDYFLKWVLFIFAFTSIRLALYDPLLNLMRRMKIDYESPTTSSYVDQHTNKLTFWDKRIFAFGAWAALVYIHYLIFKS